MNMNNRQAPTQLHERIEFVDILRGFALIGVLLMNMNAFSGACIHDRADGERH